MKIEAKLAILLAVVMSNFWASSQISNGQDLIWNVNGDGDWSTALNWDPSVVPGSANSAFIRNVASPTTPVVVTVGGGTRDIGQLSIDANGNSPHELLISNNTTFDLHGNVDNNGIITLNSTGNNTSLRADAAVVLGGTGRIVLGAGGANRLTASGNNLFTNTVDHTIEGAGNLGVNSATFLNQGLILANVNGEILSIDPRNNGAGSFTNNGMAQATNGGILTLSGNGGGEFAGAGSYLAENASQVVLTLGATVRNSVFETTGSGLVRTADSQNIELHDIVNNGKFRVGNNTDLRVHGTITNTDEITLASTGNQSDFELGSDVLLTGGGTLSLTGGMAQVNSIGNFTLTNVNNTIQGRGNLGGNAAAIVNNSLIVANVPGESLTIDPRNNGAGSFTNNATAQATSGGILTLSGNGGGEFAGGTYRAENASQVVLTSGATVRNSVFETSGSGLVTTTDSQNINLYDIVINGKFRVGNNTDLRVHGTITNSDEITLASIGNPSDFELGSDVLLTGGGTLTLTGAVAQVNSIGNFTLTNVNNTIQGRGNLGGNIAAIVNNSLIVANVPNESLTIDPRNNAVGFVNNGMAQATGGGILTLSGSGGGDFVGTGTYRAENASQVVLTVGATVRNSVFETSGSGLVMTADSQNINLHDVVINGKFRVGNNTDLRVHGTITNTDEITLASTGNQSDFELGSNVLLTGGGTLTLTGAVAQVNSIGNFTLTNVNNTIQGRGNLGGNSASITNSSLIRSNSNGGTLTLDPRNNGPGSFANTVDGTLRAENGGVLVLSGSGGGGFRNLGLIEALDGSSVSAASGATIEQLTSTVLDGTYRSFDQGSGASIDIAPAGYQPTANDANIFVSGTNAENDVLGVFSAGEHTNENLVGNTGRIRLANGAQLRLTQDAMSLTGPLLNSGEIRVGTNAILDVISREVNSVQNAGLHVTDGLLLGNGTIRGNVYMSGGTLSPGNSANQAGLLRFEGDVNMDDPAVAVESTMTVIDLGGTARGTEYDSFEATGDFFGKGELVVNLINGFRPGLGDEFVIATYVEDGAVLGNPWDTFSSELIGFSLVDRSLGGMARETVLTIADIVCDIDGNGVCDTADMRQLYDDIAAGTAGGPSDIDASGLVDNDDIDDWLAKAGLWNDKTLRLGDANLDGSVLGGDFTSLAANFGASGLPGAYWDQGNFNGNTGGSFLVGGADFTQLAANFGLVSVSAVPEPGSWSLLTLGLLIATRWTRRRKFRW